MGKWPNAAEILKNNAYLHPDKMGAKDLGKPEGEPKGGCGGKLAGSCKDGVFVRRKGNTVAGGQVKGSVTLVDSGDTY
jgi:hypothetical protein